MKNGLFSVLLVDDHQIIREGIRSILGRTSLPLELCGEAANGREAVAKVIELKPDLVILDISMPVMGGLDAAREIRSIAPKTKIVILSMHDPAQLAQQLIGIEVDAFVQKSKAATDLVTTMTRLVLSDRASVVTEPRNRN